jgi:O-antigen/teichoic acid export membrane protein
MKDGGNYGHGPALCQVEESVGAEPERAKDAAWLAGNSVITLGGGLVGRALQVGCQVALARLLGPATFGLYAIGWTLLRVANIVAPLGLDNGVIHCATRCATTDRRRLGKVLGQSLALAMLFGGLIGLGMCIAAPALAHRVFNKNGLVSLICLFAVGIPLAAGLRVASASTRVSQMMKYSVYAESLTQPAANLLLILAFYMIGWRLLGAAAAAAISFAIGLAVALHYERRLFPQALPRDLPGSGPQSTSVSRELLQFSVIAWLGVVFINFVPWVDRLFVGAYLMPAAVGIYQAAAQASVLLSVIAGALNVVVAPRISFLHQNSEMERLHQVYKVATKWMLYTCVPFLLVFCFAPGQVLGVMYGARYAEGARPLVIFSMMRLVDALAGPVGILLIFTGRQKLFSIVSGCGLVLCGALNYMLIPHLGAVGAALATFLANTAMMLGLLVGARSTVGIWPWDWRWVKGILAAAAAAGALLLAAHLALGPALLGLLLSLALSTAVFSGILLLLGLDPEDREMIRTLKGYLLVLAHAPAGEGTSRGRLA